MKKLLFSTILAFIAFSLFSQVIINENFDSFTAGSKLASQAGAPWTTWSNAPGGAEDPAISDADAFSPANSFYVTNGNDCVLLFNDLTTGRYKFEFQMNVETGHLGYFNLLQDFAGSTSEWGMQAYFNGDGTGSVDAGGASSGSFTYPDGGWFKVRIFVDLNSDFASLFVEDVNVVNWVWSTGSFGEGNLLKLDAANFYAWDVGAIPGFYVDDVIFEQVGEAEAPLNLLAGLIGPDVNLTWEAPASGTPDSYMIIKDNKVIATEITSLTYADLYIYPGVHDYSVRAFYTDLGISAASNVSSINLAGGIDRNFVLYEIGTGTWCPYCPGAAMGAVDMVEGGYNVAIVEYHNGDDYENAESISRQIYYQMDAFPTSIIDGVDGFSGGSNTVSLFPSYLNYYNNRIIRPAIFSMDLTMENTALNTYSATIDMEKLYDWFTGPFTMHMVLTESNILENWQGQTKLDFVEAKMFPDGDGTNVDFSANAVQQQTQDFTLTIRDGLYYDDYELVVFLQDETSKEIIQVDKVNLADVTQFFAGVDDINNSKISVVPNPAKSFVNITNAENSTVKIINIAGQTVFSENISAQSKQINVSELNSGIYFIEILKNGEKTVQKLIIE